MIGKQRRQMALDETQTEYLDDVDAQKAMNTFLMEVAGIDDPDQAVEVLCGGPHVGEFRGNTE